MLESKVLENIQRYIRREEEIDKALREVTHCSRIRMVVNCSVCRALAEQLADERLSNEQA